MKKLLLFCLFLFAYGNSETIAQSLGNDLCANAVTIPVNGACIAGNNNTATSSSDPSASCFSVENGTWFKFVAPASGVVNITTDYAATNFDSQIILLSGSCGSFTELACDDNSGSGNTATIQATCLTPGATYYVMLDGYAGDYGNFCIGITAPLTPYNDACTCPITLPQNGSCVNGTTVNATDGWTGSVGCQSAGTNVEVWYTFVATQTGMDFNVTAGTLTGNVELTLVQGTCSGTLTQVGFSCGPAPLAYSISNLTVGATYYVTISTPVANAGTFTICGTAFTPPPVPGQDCPTAAVLCNNTPFSQGTFTGIGTISEVLTTNTCFSGNERQSKWYKFTIGCSGTLGFNINPNTSSNDYDWALWNTNCAVTMPASVACNWSGCVGSTGISSNPSSEAGVNSSGAGCGGTTAAWQNGLLNVTAGQTYTLLIDNFTASGGGFNFNFSGTAVIGPDATFNVSKNCYSVTVSKSCSTTNSTYLWDFGDGFTSTSAGPVTHTYADEGTYTISLQVTDALGCSKVSTQNVTLALPTVFAGENDSICDGGQATLNAIGTMPPVVSPQTFTNSNPLAIPDNNTTGATSNIVVSGIYPNTVGANPIVTVCLNITHTWDEDLDISLRCPGGTTIDLSSDNGGSNNNYTNTCFSSAGSPITAGTAPFTGTFTPEQALSLLNACSINGTWSLIVKDDVGGDVGTINNWSITFNSSNSLTYSWSPATGLSSTNTATTIASPTTTTDYIVTVTDAFGCIAKDTINIFVKPSPVAPTAAGTSICANNTATLNATAPSGGTFAWYDAATGGTLLASGSSYTTPVLTSTTNYWVSAYVAGCLGPRTQVTVTVNQIPVATATPATSSLCSNNATSIALTSTIGGTTFAWTASASSVNITGESGGSGSTIAQTLINNSSAPETVTYTITPTANLCVGSDITATVTVNPVPTATATPASETICSNETTAISLSSNVAGTTFAWTVTTSSGSLTGASNGSGNSIAQTLVNPLTVAHTATYTITPTANGCAGSPITVVITVDPIPAVTATPASESICTGDATSISLSSAVAGTTFSWTVSTSAGTLTGASAGSGSSIAQTLTNSSTTAQTATYTITPTANGCAGTPVIATVTVNPEPTATATPATETFCSGNSTSISLTSNVIGTTFAWTVVTSDPGLTGASAGSGSTIAQALSNSTSVVQTATYTITPTAGTCVGAPITVTINVTPIDNPAFNYASSTYCQTGTDPVANITGGASGTFSSSPAGLVFVNTSTGEIDLSASALNTYTITFTTNGTCPSSSTFSVTITSAPSATFSYAGPYCTGGADPSPTFGAGASAGTFSALPVGLVFVSTSTGQIDVSASTPGLYTVTNTIAAAGGCSPALATSTVTIDPTPAAPTAAGTTICANNTATVNATAPGGTYQWFDALSGGTLLFTGASFTSPILTNTTIYYVQTTVGGCTSARTAVTITVNPIPNVVATPATQTICSTNSTSISLSSAVTGTTFSWTAASSDALLTGASGGSGNSIAQTLTNGASTIETVTYTITPSANSCNGSPLDVVITVNPKPVATATPASETICSNDLTAVTLSSNVTGTTFDWTVTTSSGTLTGTSNGSGTTIAQTLVNTSATAQTATYTVTPTANGCAGDPITVIITVDPTPSVTATPASQTICSEDITSINLTSNVAGATFSWTVVTSDPSLTGASAGTGSSIAQTLTNGSTTVQTATYTITPTASSCDGAPVMVVITVNPKPVATATPASQTICSGTATNIALSSNVTGTTFSWTVVSTGTLAGASAGSGNTISQTLTNSSATSETATYTITPTSTCGGNPITVVVTVDPKPVLTVNPLSQTFCSGGTTSINLTSNVAGTTFDWTQTSSSATLTGSSNGSGASISQLLTNTGNAAETVTYIITPTANGCTGNPVTATVTVDPRPILTATPSSEDLCSGGTTNVSLSANVGGTTFGWSVATSDALLTGATAGTGNTIAQTLTNGSTLSQTAIYTITPTANGCAGTPVDVVVTVNPNPTAIATPADQTFCSGGTTSINLTSDLATTTFDWTFSSSGSVTGASAGSGSTISQTLLNSSQNVQTVSYTVTPTAGTCVGTPITVVITIDPTDDPSFNYTSSTYCQTGVDPLANITGGSTGTFTSSPAGLVFIDATTGEIDLDASALNTYTITFTTNGTCPSSATFNVTITNAPSAVFSYAGPYCEGAVNPNPVFDPGASAGTFTSGPGLVFVSSTTGQVDLSASTPGTYTVTNTITAGGGCAAASHDNTITINALPDPSFSNLSATYCIYDPAAVLNPVTAGGSFNGTGISGTSFDPSVAGAGTHSIEYVVTVAGCSDSLTINTTVNPSPNSTFSGIVSPYCISDAAVTLIPVTAGGTFTGTGIVPVNTFDPQVAGAGTFDLQYNVTVLGCIDSTIVSVTVNPNPDPTFTGLGLTYCTNDANDTLLPVTAGGTFSGPGITGDIFNPAVAGAGTHIIKYVVVSGFGCSDSSEISVTVDPLQVADFDYAATTFCKTGTNPVPTIQGGVSGTFTSASAVFVDATTGEIDLANTPTGNHSVTFTTTGTCPDDSTITITVTDSPDASFTFASPFCMTGLNPSPSFGAGASAGVFTSTSGLTIDPATGIIDLNTSTPGTYDIVNLINVAGCATAADTQQVVINPVPTAIVNGNDTICAGSSIIVDLTGSAPWTITFSDGSDTLIASSPFIYSPVIGTDTIISVSDANCSSVLTAGGMVLTVLDSIQISNVQVTCNAANTDYTVSFEITGGDTSSYSVTGNGGTLTSSAPYIYTSSLIPSGTAYSFIANDIFNCYADSISGSQLCACLATATMTGSDTICPGDSALITVNLSGTGPWSIVYTDGTVNDSVNSIASSPYTFYVSAGGLYEVVEVTDAVCTNSGTDSALIVVTTNPDSSFTGLNTDYCISASSVTLTPAVTGGTFSGAGISADTFDPSTAGAGAHVITYTVTNSYGCQNSSTQNVTVNTLPDPAFSGLNSTYCNSGSSITLTPVTSGGIFSGPSVSGVTFDPASLSAGTYTVAYSVTDSNGCVDSSSQQVIITDAPSANISGGGIVCQGDTAPSVEIALTGSGPWTITYTDGVSNSTVTSTISPFVINSPGTGIYTIVSVSDAICAGNGSGNALVGFNPLPVVNDSLLRIDTADCQVNNGGISGLTFSGGTAPYNYVWTNSAGDTVSNGVNADVVSLASDDYVLICSDNNGCSATYNATVPVIMGVLADFTMNPDSGQAPLPVTFTNTSVGADAYSWDFGDGATSEVIDPKHLFKDEGTYTVTLIASKFTVCTDTISFTVEVTNFSEVIYPNIFTPNGDGRNDLFAFKTQALAEFECTIYNRWGEKVYYWTSVNGGWDGKTMSGTEASEGVYFFIMKAKGDDGKLYPNNSGYLQGTVTLTR